MTTSPDKEAEIRRLFFAEHFLQGTIVTQLGVHPDVVQRVVGTVGRKAGQGRTALSLLDPYKSFIDETLKQYPRLRATRILDMIQARGYEGQIGLVRPYVKANRPTPKGEVFLRLEPLVGEQAQVDWGHVGYLPVCGGKRALWVFVIVLAFSRAIWAELVLDMDIHSLIRSLVRASTYFGGVSRQWLFDNPKTVVIERSGDVVRYHHQLLDLCGQMRVQPRLCGVRKPHEKGKVERAVRFLKERFFAGRTIHSIEHGNAQLLSFLSTISLERRHPRFADRSVADVLLEEQARLLPLPDPVPCTDMIVPVAVDKTAFVRLDTNSYSVPARYARATLTLVASDTQLRLLDGETEVARHKRDPGFRQRLELPEHRAEILAHKRAASDLKGRDRIRAEIPAIDALIARWADNNRHMGAMTTRTLKLLDLYGAEILAKAVQELLARGGHDPGALAVHCEQFRRHDSPATLPVCFGSHVPEHDVVPHDLGGYDE